MVVIPKNGDIATMTVVLVPSNKNTNLSVLGYFRTAFNFSISVKKIKNCLIGGLFLKNYDNSEMVYFSIIVFSPPFEFLYFFSDNVLILIDRRVVISQEHPLKTRLAAEVQWTAKHLRFKRRSKETTKPC